MKCLNLNLLNCMYQVAPRLIMMLILMLMTTQPAMMYKTFAVPFCTYFIALFVMTKHRFAMLLLQCLPEPLAPQYNGGIVINPTFDQDLVGWTVYDGGQIGLETSSSGNKYVVSYNRTEYFHGVAQVFTVKKETMYILSGYVRFINSSIIFLLLFFFQIYRT